MGNNPNTYRAQKEDDLLKEESQSQAASKPAERNKQASKADYYTQYDKARIGSDY